MGLQLLERAGALYDNTPAASAYLCKQSPSRLTGYINYSNAILWKLWGNLEDAVREGTNRWQQTFGWDGPIFSNFFRTEEAMREFLMAHARVWTHQLAARRRRLRPEPVSAPGRPGRSNRSPRHRRLPSNTQA